MNITPSNIFDINRLGDLLKHSEELVHYHRSSNPVYSSYINHLGKTTDQVNKLEDIIFLPVELFKTQQIITNNSSVDKVFESSGTTGTTTSKHYIHDISIYKKSYLTGFQYFYGNPGDYCILAMLPSYSERAGSSLVTMMEGLISQSIHPCSGFYNKDYKKLKNVLLNLEKEQQKTLLIGVSFALAEFAEKNPMNLEHTIVMETGGMKGRREEITRKELHQLLSKQFGIRKVHSEYGMTELLSQAYSKGHGRFKTPPWMKILIRDPYDPFSYLHHGKTGGINIIDLANIYSCPFIATQDLGKMHPDGTFEVLGRFDQSDTRGCNLLIV